jgi:hypothetical protein
MSDHQNRGKKLSGLSTGHGLSMFVLIGLSFLLTSNGCEPQASRSMKGSGKRSGQDDSAAKSHEVEKDLQLQIADVIAGKSVEIRFTRGRVTDDDLATLSVLAKPVEAGKSDNPGKEASLETLVLGRTEITDKGLAILCRVSSLKILNIAEAAVSDLGLDALPQLEHLDLLRLGSKKITGPGLGQIAKISSLRQLILMDMPVDDDAIQQLKGMKQLESLYLVRTKVTDKGVARLTEALPELHVHW